MPDFSRRSFVTTATLASLAPALPAWAAQGPSPTAVDPIFGDDIVRLDYNESPYGPTPSAVKAMELGARQSGRYYYEQQVRLIELFARQNRVPADHVAVFCGSRSPLQYGLARYAERRSVVTGAPTYDSVAAGANAVGTTVHEVPLDTQHAHDVRAMLAADPQAGVFYLCNPNNPTGTLTPRAEIEYLVTHKPAGCLAIIDEAYIHFSEAQPCLDLAVQHDDVMVLRTFSKLYGMAGARLGLAIAKPKVLGELQRLNGHNFISIAASLGGIASLEQADLVSDRKRTNRRVLLETTQRLQTAGYRCTDAQANCFMVELRRPAQPVIEALAKRKVQVGRVFDAWPDWMRVTVGTPQQMQTFLSAFFAVMQH
ncbi:aminotransferase class I/II-fold pyridoxal phosphate-dependent enzyme [Pseudomonas eucalypticola]|uniref:Aminotransferase class I/II-fold pyridoxal phosphate-dependent enzyme n=1 Tax=Pseudomonas eucalypticola TaxID=2599595 RepID=A0A7D5D6S1_9PSED|nr:aminotransferase class I/II-fold pyridoxal phosphate-dependent enzyme [Pseudomonas eucalypticola]QKZ04400.1 aminotransferase class I/II-fold pyridoxal phosphate-dependent enzyme [Pseudomonas eucalypticola]